MTEICQEGREKTSGMTQERLKEVWSEGENDLVIRDRGRKRRLRGQEEKKKQKEVD